VDGCCLRPADDVERDGLMGLAAEAADLEESKAGIERIAERRRRLGRSLKAEHALVPSLAGASRSACLRASAARSADARIEPP
jgi:hypothetical protein